MYHKRLFDWSRLEPRVWWLDIQMYIHVGCTVDLDVHTHKCIHVKHMRTCHYACQYTHTHLWYWMFPFNLHREIDHLRHTHTQTQAHIHHVCTWGSPPLQQSCCCHSSHPIIVASITTICRSLCSRGINWEASFRQGPFIRTTTPFTVLCIQCRRPVVTPRRQPVCSDGRQ